jgi:hypothetical protein
MKGLPEPVVRLVEDSYKDLHTNIKQGTVEVSLKLQRGVKQGDPLSPFIYIAVLEPLLRQLEILPGYEVGERASVSSLAFPDDLFLQRLMYHKPAPCYEQLGSTLEGWK